MADDLYRELILDHYKNPHNHGTLDPYDARAEGQNPLCGDEIAITLSFNGGDTIEDIRFAGRGCAISQAAASMLTDLVKGRPVREVASMPTEELLDEIGTDGKGAIGHDGPPEVLPGVRSHRGSEVRCEPRVVTSGRWTRSSPRTGGVLHAAHDLTAGPAGVGRLPLDRCPALPSQPR